jgi:hypothetical protein
MKANPTIRESGQGLPFRSQIGCGSCLVFPRYRHSTPNGDPRWLAVVEPGTALVLRGGIPMASAGAIAVTVSRIISGGMPGAIGRVF